MSKSYEEMSLEELKKIKEEKDKTSYIKTLKDAEAKEKLEAEAQKVKEMEEHDAKVIADFKALNPVVEPTPKIEGEGDNKNAGDNKLQNFYNDYFKRNKTVTSPSDKEVTLSKNAEGAKFQTYQNQTWGEVGFSSLFENTDSDTGCEDDVSAWSPDDVYSKIIWNTAVSKADLFKLAVKGLAINPGDGLGVQIRIYGQFGDPVEKNSCECGSCASIAFSVKSLTLKQYNLEAIVCEKDIWDVGSILMDAYINAMSDSWASWFDWQIYNELETATPGNTETLANALSCDPTMAGSCCSDTALIDLYNSIRSARTTMREGTNPYKPDYIVISPSVGDVFRRMQTPTATFGTNSVHFDENGDLTKIAGLKVVEYCRANACSDATGEVMAILIDSRRAVGAIFGQKPKMYKEFQSNCNSYRVDYWSFFAVGELDTAAIIHIVNP